VLQEPPGKRRDSISVMTRGMRRLSRSPSLRLVLDPERHTLAVIGVIRLVSRWRIPVRIAGKYESTDPAGERSLGIDNQPAGAGASGAPPNAPRLPTAQRSPLEPQAACSMETGERSHNSKPAEQGAHNTRTGRKKFLRQSIQRCHPRKAFRRARTPWDVEGDGSFASPSVPDEGRAEPCAKWPGVSSDRHQGADTALNRGVIDDRLFCRTQPLPARAGRLNTTWVIRNG